MHSAELAILDWIQTHLRCEFLDMAMPWISWTANHGEIWILLAVVLVLLKGQRRHGAAVAFGLTLDLIAWAASSVCGAAGCGAADSPSGGCLISLWSHGSLFCRRVCTQGIWQPFVEAGPALGSADCVFPSVPLCSLAQRCSGGSGARSRCRLVGSKACGGRSGSDQS